MVVAGARLMVVGQVSADLFGERIPDQQPPTTDDVPDQVTNDIDEVVAVLRLAGSERYSVVGARQQVWRCLAGPVIEPVARYEADIVRQLLDVGWLTVGGVHVYEYQGGDVAGRAVLVPKWARQWLSRWDSRKPLGQLGGA